VEGTRLRFSNLAVVICVWSLPVLSTTSKERVRRGGYSQSRHTRASSQSREQTGRQKANLPTCCGSTAIPDKPKRSQTDGVTRCIKHASMNSYPSSSISRRRQPLSLFVLTPVLANRR
jgi:hypothetical protein